MASRWINPLRSVRVRITLAAVLVTAVAVGMAGWVLVRSVEGAQVGDIRREVDAYLDQVAARLRAGEAPQPAVSPVYGLPPPPARLRVTDDRGQIVAAFPEGGDVGDAEDVAVGEDFEPEGGVIIGPEDEFVLAETETLTRLVETPDGPLSITADAPVDQIARNVDQLATRLTVGLPALVALVGLIAWLLVGRALRPVESMRTEVEQITGSTMNRRVPEPPTGDEIARLASTMNRMLERLETAAAQQRRFVSDASHELRSPVATLRAALEVARAQPGPQGWPARVDGLLAEESRLESLLDDLLLLASQDERGAVSAPATTVNVTALAVEEAQRPRKVPVQVIPPSGDGAVLVTGAREHLARALSNLVDNAARHATSLVQIRVFDVGDTARLVIDDDGPGIPASERERIFERFARLDDGRARPDGGSGLGLAVVRSIITRHHGTITVGDSPLGGARFAAELPSRPFQGASCLGGAGGRTNTDPDARRAL